MILSSILFQLLSFTNGLNDFNMYVLNLPKPDLKFFNLVFLISIMLHMHINTPEITPSKIKTLEVSSLSQPSGYSFISFLISLNLFLSLVCFDLWISFSSFRLSHPSRITYLPSYPSLSFMINHFENCSHQKHGSSLVFMPTFHFLNQLKPIMLFILLCRQP